MSRLDDLDARWVPVLAARLRSLVDGGGRRRSTVLRWGEQAWQSLLAPGSGSFLRRLDDRYASKGPLALVREVPQLGILLVALVFLGGAGVALARSGPSDADQQRQFQESLAAGEIPTVGPDTGAGVQDYIEATTARVVDLNRADPDKRYTAMVSFVAYAKVEDIADLVDEVDVKKVFSRAKSAGSTAEVLQISVQDVVQDTRKVFAATAQRKARDQQDNLSQARSITSAVGTEQAFKAEFVRQAEVDGKEAAAYRTTCPCVFAVLVEGEARELAELLQTGGVRAVDAAVAGATAVDVEVTQFFLPEDKGTVPVRPKPIGQDYGSTSGS